MNETIAIIGGGNLGRALARGLSASGAVDRGSIVITRRSEAGLQALRDEGFTATRDNASAASQASLVLVAVRPKQVNVVLDELKNVLNPDRHLLVSTVSDASIEHIERRIGGSAPVIRAMPNIGVAVGASMTCLAAAATASQDAKRRAEVLFEPLGRVEFIEEAQMTPATALCACGVAFFLRAIRAASQGGVQVGFHADEAIRLAAQTAKGAAELVLASDRHPEALIDSVTTPLGVTIAGLNEMEHQGFGSALIRGIVLSAERARGLYDKEALGE